MKTGYENEYKTARVMTATSNDKHLRGEFRFNV